MLSSSIISKLRENQFADRERGLAIFYCDGNVPEKKDLRWILGSVIRQLVPASTDTNCAHMKSLKLLRKNNIDKPCEVSELASSIHSISKLYKEVYVIVDGLDECSKPTDVCVAISTLAHENIKILVTSRPDRDIANSFSAEPTLEIKDAWVNEDIATYIDWRLARDETLVVIKPGLKLDIKNSLVKQSDGMY